MLLANPISYLAFGALTAYLAKRRGKAPIVWFILGALFNVFALLFLLLDTNLKKRPKRENDPKTIDITPSPDKD